MKPQRHLGQINSDAVLRPYEQAYADMPRKYRIEDSRIPLLRRLRTWAVGWVRKLFS